MAQPDDQAKHDGPEIDEATGTQTTGHVWDGIRELNTPMPLWWLYTFYATVVFALVWVVLYPAVPMVRTATSGILGYASRAEVEKAVALHQERNAERNSALAAADYDVIKGNPDLHRYALAAGAAVFKQNCSTCHGAGAAGARGYPNLLDDDWLWGGSIEAIADTVAYGVNADHPDSRYTEMPAFGDQKMLSKDEIAAVAEEVLALAGLEHDAALAAAGAETFAVNCSSCHGEEGQGMPELGAPALNDAIWLYGGDRETVLATITHGRAGMMPAWSTMLDEAEIKAVSLYVHALGGGE
ncbi:MAG: cytochrome-c oxidase, cbb3-type subunit III [Pseudomonadota bacterium]